MTARLVATLVNKFDERFDVTDRLELSAVGNFTEALESELSVYSHSDLSVSFRDTDGFISEQFRGVRPTDTFELIIERETGRRRPRYERMFAGVLDLPWSVKTDTRRKRVSVTVFSYSKKLELASAESVRRTWDGAVGTVTSGTKTVTIGGGVSAGTLARGDLITLSDGANSEQQTVSTIDSDTQVTTVANWSNTFEQAIARLDTPYWREATVDELMGLVLDAADVDDYSIDTPDTVWSYPIAQPIKTSNPNLAYPGLPAGDPLSLTDEADFISLTYLSGSGNRRIAAGPSTGFYGGAASNFAQGDWRPYLTSEPGTIKTRSGVYDLGLTAWNHTAGRYYWLTMVPGATTSVLTLHDDAGLSVVVDTYAHGLGDPSGWTLWVLEYDANRNTVWISYRRTDGSQDETTIYNLVAATFTSVSTTVTGQLRSVRGSSFVNDSDDMHMLLLQDDDLYVYRTNAPTAAPDLAYTLTAPISSRLWTYRFTGDVAAVLYPDAGKMRLRLWSTPDHTQIADYEVSASISGAEYLTVWTDPADSASYLVGYASGEYFIVADTLIGVVPYADFSGLSCGAALRELALISGTYATVGHDNVVTVQPRVPATPDTVAPVLDQDFDGDDLAALEETVRPLWEDWRGSVKVSGKDTSGDSVEVIVGDTGDSAHRLEVTAAMPTTAAVLRVIGLTLLAYVNVERREVSRTSRIREMLVRPADEVRLHGLGGSWLCVSAVTSHQRSTQELRLVELV